MYVHTIHSLVDEDIYMYMLLNHLPSRRQKVFYAQSKERPNVEGISNALGLPTRDQLHKVFLQISLNVVIREKWRYNVNFVRKMCNKYVQYVDD